MSTQNRTFLVAAALIVLCGPTLFAAEPTKAQRAWLKKNAVPIKTVEAGNGFEDLAPLKKLIGDARIVSLGESTHGSREIFQMKHRLVEFLATKMGFTIFAIEASMPEAYRLNDYVLRGKGDPKPLIGGMHFWTWNTEEVLAMVEWMRVFNTSGKGRIEFTGFDMQTPDLAMRNVLQFLAKHDAAALKLARAAYDKVGRTSVRPSGPAFGVATGSFPVKEARGKRVTFSGWIKAEKVTSFAGLWWRVDGPGRKVAAFDNMARTGPRGTKDWKKFSIELKVPKNAVNINFGVLMPGQGTAWFDGLEIQLDGKKYASKFHTLDFEGRAIRGFAIPAGPAYRVALDKAVAKTGKQSLRIESRKVAAKPDAVSATTGLKAANEVLEELEALRKQLVKKAGAKQTDWAIQNARIVLQCMSMRVGKGGLNVRDLSMAENVAWILKQKPKAKIVLWAHNGHVAKRPQSMGGFLDGKFGNKHLAVGFATSKGTYQALARGKGLSEHKLQEPPDGSAEAAFGKCGLPRFVLDLRAVDAKSDGSGWLAKPLLFRRIGALATVQQFGRQNLRTSFDAIIYIEKTSRARPIGRGKR